MMIQTLQQFLAYFVDDFIKQIFQEENMLFNVKHNPKLQTIELSPDFKTAMSQQVAGLEINQNDLDFTNKLNDRIFEYFYKLYTKEIFQILETLWELEKVIPEHQRLIMNKVMDFLALEFKADQECWTKQKRLISDFKDQLEQEWLNFKF